MVVFFVCPEKPSPPVNIEYLNKAKEKQPNIPLLINMVSRRVRQLNSGLRPLVKPDHPHMERMDIALKEIAEGLLECEMLEDPDHPDYENPLLRP